jgi:sensor histidine kinase YesM
MNRLFIHHTVFRICAAPILGVLVYLLILLINNSIEGVSELFSHEELYVCIAVSYLTFESMRLAVKLVEKKGASWPSRKRILFQTTATLLVNLGMVYLSISSYFLMALGFSIGRYELYVFMIIFGVTGLLYNLLYFSHYYLQQENKLRVEQERKLQEKVEADFASFRSEINPDLLYESLENLILTIHNNADQAEEQIDYLAGIYRYSLVNRQKELVSLDEERHAAQNLLSLLNYRYNGQLNLIAEIPKEREILLIPGSLLISIDAIVRNTLLSAKSPLVIRLYLEEEDDYLVLQHTMNDRLMKHQESMDSFSRLQRSYAFFSDKPFVQVKAGRENYIKFPLIRVSQETDTIERT